MPRKQRSRTTVYLDPRVLKAIKIKAAASGRTISEFANEGLVRLLREDARDLKIFRERRNQRSRPYDEFIAELEKRGEI